MIDWAFRNRETGRLTIAQLPNVSLGVFLAATLARRVLAPEGTAGTVLWGIGTATLAWWSADELVRGVNPWRRFLGGVGLIYVGARLLGGPHG